MTTASSFPQVKFSPLHPTTEGCEENTPPEGTWDLGCMGFGTVRYKLLFIVNYSYSMAQSPAACSKGWTVSPALSLKWSPMSKEEANPAEDNGAAKKTQWFRKLLSS